uniref:Ig-like domain-containing protein n=1 Tax=Chelonoidis abingdonii TaxID=106734 RepID=A0A8C0GZ16_CHEAB
IKRALDMRLSRCCNTLTYIILILSFYFPEVSCCDVSVDQSPPEVTISEGQSATLHCNFTTLDTSPYLFWYRQYPNQPPQHILTKTNFDAPGQALVQGKFSASLYLDNRTVPFQIEAVSHQESAVYFCALRPTVRENCISAPTKSEREVV